MKYFFRKGHSVQFLYENNWQTVQLGVGQSPARSSARTEIFPYKLWLATAGADRRP